MIKHATYLRPDGTPFAVAYDAEAPCVRCGFPVVAPSMSGTAMCPWCDMGQCRFDRSHRVDTPEGARAHYARVHSAERRN